jgi:hypothetical protein
MTTDAPVASARAAAPSSTPSKLAAAAAILLVVAAACSSGTTSQTPGPTTSPTTAPTPTAAPTQGGIQHPTGATDVLLRMDTSGGFAPIEFMATSAPTFTLYGDGTVVFRDPMAPPPDPLGNVTRLSPFLTVRLGEEGIQALLEDAIGRGALGIAAGPYIGMGADIPTTTFTITADGRTKAVSVVGLSPDMHPNDSVIVTALSALADRLQGFASVIAGEQPYVPAAFRGVVMSVDQAFGPVVAWPWPGVQPTDFKGDQNEFLLTRTMTPAEVAALGVPGAEGGLQGVTLQSGGKLYSFSLRPLLPDETK